MKLEYITNRDRQEIGIQQMGGVFYKEQLKNGMYKKIAIIYFLIIVAFLLLYLTAKEDKEMIAICLLFTVAMIPVIIIVYIIGYQKAKKIKLPSNIIRYKHELKEDYKLTVELEDENCNVLNYAYEEIKKVIENKEFFFIFVGEQEVIILDKLSVDNVEELKNFIKSKNIIIKEV